MWEQVVPNHSSDEQDNPLIIPVIVQRVLGRVIDAYSRLPYHIDYSFVRCTS